MRGEKAFRFAICCAVAVLGGAIAARPAQESTKTGPFTAEQAKAGLAIYETTCSQCHLDDLTGTFEAPPWRARIS